MQLSGSVPSTEDDKEGAPRIGLHASAMCLHCQQLSHTLLALGLVTVSVKMTTFLGIPVRTSHVS